MLFDWDDPAGHADALRGADDAPPQTDVRAVEADLAARAAITHNAVRPAWVMQDFSDAHLPVVDGAVTVPTGSGAEAFVDAADIAAGHGSTPDDDVERVTGRKATAFREFAQRNAHSWTRRAGL